MPAPKHQTGDTVLVAMVINGKHAGSGGMYYTVVPRSGVRSIVIREEDIVENRSAQVIKPAKTNRVIRPTG